VPARVVSNEKSATVYECFPFIWAYNAQPAQLASSLLFLRIRNEKRSSIEGCSPRLGDGPAGINSTPSLPAAFWSMQVGRS
jgi:hypothetical protein